MAYIELATVQVPSSESNQPFLASVRTPWYVMNKDTTQQTSDDSGGSESYDAQRIIAAANQDEEFEEGDDRLNIIVLDNPGGLPHLNLAHLISGAVGSMDTDLWVRCFGWHPDAGRGAVNRSFLPNKYNEAAFDSIMETINGKGFCFPLFNPRTGLHTQKFTGSAEVHAQPYDLNAFALHSANLFVYTNGARRVFAVIEQAVSGIDAGMLLGAFSA